MAVPGQRPPGGRGGRPRGNLKTFAGVGGKVPPPPKTPTIKGDGSGGWGCPLSVAAPVLALTALAACHAS